MRSRETETQRCFVANGFDKQGRLHYLLWNFNVTS